MAVITVKASPTAVGAVSTWEAYEKGYNEVGYTTPTTDGGLVTITLPADLVNAVFNSARLSYTGSGNSGTKNVRYNKTATTVTDANLLKKLQDGETTIQIYFSYRAAGGTSALKGTYEWYDICLIIDYTPSGSITGTLAAGSTYATYSLSKKTLAKGETNEMTLAIKPAINMTSLTVDVGDSAHSTYTSTTYSVTASSGTNIYATFNINIDSSSLTNRVNTAYLRLTVKGTSGTYIGSWTQSDLKILSGRVNPAVSCAWTDLTSIYSSYGSYVQGLSNLSCAISVALDTEADEDIYITERLVSFGTSTYTGGSNTIAIGAPRTSGEVSYTASVTDNYGNKGSASGTLTVTAYEAPILTRLLIQRYNGALLDDDSSTVWVTYSGGFSPIGSSADSTQNKWSMKAKISASGQTAQTVTMESAKTTSVGAEKNTSYFSAYTFAPSLDWTFEITLSDNFNSNVYVVTVPKAGGIFSIEEYGVGVGQRAVGTSDEPKFSVAYKSDFHKDVVFDGNVTITGTTTLNEITGNTDWTALTLQNCSQASGFGECAVKRINGIVFVRGAVNLDSDMSSSGSNSLLLATIPEGFRPDYNLLVDSGTRSNRSSVEIDSDGSVRLWNRIGDRISTGEVVSINACFAI